MPNNTFELTKVRETRSALILGIGSGLELSIKWGEEKGRAVHQSEL